VSSAFTLATFNVKDLFDAADDAGRAPLDAKLENLAGILTQADADVVALQEVGSLEVARALCARVPALGYGEPVVGTADARGIRCAVIGRAPVLASKVHVADHLDFPAFFDGDPPPFGARIPLRRGVVHVRVDARGIGPVDLLVAHFKSNRGVPLKDARGEPVALTTARSFAEAHLRSLVWRAAEALFVRGLVDELLAADPARPIVVAGDLNDHPTSHVVRIVSGGGPDALQPCAEAVPAASRFSIYLRGEPQQIDHVLVTPPLRQRLQSARFLNEALRDHGELGEGGTVPLPDSDHAALVVSFA
jgi:endonuclease/exonuclease/phosphatase family metal-dependent hydrolase